MLLVGEYLLWAAVISPVAPAEGFVVSLGILRIAGDGFPVGSMGVVDLS